MPETAERILAQLETVLAALATLADDPGRTLGSVPELPGGDRGAQRITARGRLAEAKEADQARA